MENPAKAKDLAAMHITDTINPFNTPQQTLKLKTSAIQVKKACCYPMRPCLLRHN
jgi:hypothetical protein